MNAGLAWGLRAVASLVLLGAVIWQIGAASLLDTLAGVSMGWVALAVGALVLQILLSAWRWQVTAQALGLKIDIAGAMREYGLSVLVNTFLPGGVLGDLGRVLRLQHMGGWRLAAASVVIERLAGQVMLALVTILGVVLWFGPRGAIFAVAAALLIWGGWFWFGRVLPRAGLALRQGWFESGIWRMQGMLSLLILLCNLFGFWAAARSLDIILPLTGAMLILPLTLLVMLFPVTLNGWGLREGAAALLWPLIGIEAAQAVSASVLFGLAIALAALIGAMPWMARLGRGRAVHIPKGE